MYIHHHQSVSGIRKGGLMILACATVVPPNPWLSAKLLASCLHETSQELDLAENQLLILGKKKGTKLPPKKKLAQYGCFL